MTTQTLTHHDLDSTVRFGADSIAELIATPATIDSIESMTVLAPTSMAAVVDGSTIVFGLAIGADSLLDLTRSLMPGLESEPDETMVENARTKITARFFEAVEEAIGQPLVEVDPEPFDTTVRIAFGDAAIEVGVASIPVDLSTNVPPAASRLSTVRLDVSVELGRAKIPVKELLALDEGGVIRLGRPVGEPVDLVVNGTVTARGEIVVVDGRLGLRITSLV
jgi:flagellar motor switch protein FliN/FliY